MQTDRQPDGLPTGVSTPPIWLQRELAERGGRLSWFLDASPKDRHGRREIRVCWVLADPDQNAYVGSSGTHGTPWPRLRQIGAIERHRLQVRRGQIIATEAEVRYYVTSLAPERADAKALLALARGHWGIENRLHHVRDVTFDEDRSQMRSGAVPQTFAACRNLAIGLLRSAGAVSIAAALRTFAARPADAALLVLATGLL
ncbi:MAG TPA: ISAs1 family transposase [Nonomuraea sp.]|nr:ISAs1 family transposase [Nonomuraea sp.]